MKSNPLLRLLLIPAMLLFYGNVRAQLSLTTSGSTVTIDFSTAVSGVNASNVNSTNGGAMLAPTPSTGQLDADAWAFTKDGATSGAAATFPGSLSADFSTFTTAGTSNTGWGMANISSNRMLAILPSGSQATPGIITLKITNNTGSALDSLIISYFIEAYNDQPRGNKVEFYYSTSNNANTYTNVSAATFTSSATATSSFETATKTISLGGLNLANGSTIYLRWFFDDATGSNNRDEFYLDDISIRGVTGASANVVVSSTALNEFVSGAVSTPSSSQSFTVSGTNLTSDITVTPPTGFEVSTSSGSGFGSSVSITPVSGTVSTTTIYARYNPASLANQPQDIATNLINITSTGAATKTVGVTGSITNLSSGDIALIGFNTSTTDAISFVALTTIPANTIIRFTDNGYSDAGTQMTGEGFLTYTVQSTLSPGTVVSWSNGMTITGTGWNSANPSGFALNASGEQMFAYQGTWGVAGGTTTLLQGLISYLPWTTTGTVPNTSANSYLPAGLTNGVNAAALDSANAYYTNNTSNTVNSKSTIFNRIANTSNWTLSSSRINPIPTWSFNILPEEPTVQPSFSSTTSVGSSSMTLNFTGGNGASYIVVMKASSAVTGAPVDATTYTANSAFGAGSILNAGEYIVYSGSSSIGNVTVTGLASGTTYFYSIFSYNGTGTSSNYLTTAPGAGSQTTSGAPPSSNSNIILNTSFTEPSNINYSTYQGTDINVSNSIEVAQFTIQDGGGAADADAFGTELTAISFNVTNSSVLRRVAIYDGSTEIAEVAAGSTLTFNSFASSIIATDDGTKTFSLRVSFLSSSITDNVQFGFTISSVSSNPALSQFATVNGGGASTTANSDENRIEITATTLAFVQQPTSVAINTAISPSVTISANDANGNRDLDYTTDMTAATSGTFAAGATTTVTPVNGLGTFSNLLFSVSGTSKTISVSSGSLSATGNSNSFDITSNLSAGDIAIIGFGSSGTDKFAFIALTDIPANTVLTFTDKGWTGSAFFANESDQVIWTSPSTILSAGTVVTVTNSSSPATVSYGTATGVMNGIASGGDQVICYRGTSSSPTFIAAFSSSAWLTSGSATSNTSYLPTGLIAGYSASSVTTQFDNGYYNNLLNAPANVLRNMINTTSNWTTSSSSQTFPSFATTISTAGTLTNNAAIFNVGLGSGETLSIGAFTLTVNGTISGSGTITGSSSSNLTINGTGGTLVLTAGSQVLKNLTLAANASLSLGTTCNITAGSTPGTVTLGTSSTLNSSGNLVIKSDASGTARIAAMGTGASINGSVTVERYLPATRRAFRFLASPVTTTNIYNNWQEGGNNATGLGIQITGSVGSSAGTDPSTGLDYTRSGSKSMFTCQGSTWTAVSNTLSTGLTTGVGYRVLVRGDRTTDLFAASTPGASATTIRATGTVGAGQVSTSSLPVGFNLVGNPYPSAINWDATGWNTARGSNFSNAFYIYNPSVTASASSTVYPAWSAGSGTNGMGDGIIRQGQAFFVENLSAASLVFQESYKVANTNGGFFKTAQLNHLRVEMKEDTNHVDEIIIRFKPDALNTFDFNYDARSIGGDEYGIATLKGNDRLAIQTRNDNFSETVVPISVKATKTGTFSLVFTEVSTFETNYSLILRDKYLSKEQSITGDKTYSFDITSDSLTKGDTRFDLVFKKKPTGVETLTKVNDFTLFPNPATDKVYIQLTSTRTGEYTYVITDLNGKTVSKGSYSFNGNSPLEIPVNQLNQGVYLITIQDAGSTQTLRFIK